MGNKEANLFIVLITCVVPAIINPFGIDHFYYPKIVLVGILCAIMTLYFIRKDKFKEIKLDKLDYILLVYMGLVVLSTIFSVDIMQSLEGRYLRYEGLGAVLCYFLIYLYARKYYNFSKSHLKYLVTFSVIISVYGICQYFGFDPIPRDVIGINQGNNIFSTIGHRNFLGGYLTLVIPIIIYSYISTKRIIYFIVSGILYFCLLCTVTRSAWIAAILYIIMMAVFVRKDKLQLKGMIKIVLLFFCITISFYFFVNSGIQNRFVSIGKDASAVINNTKEAEAGGSGRIFIWKRALNFIPERPLLGSGIDTFNIVFMAKYGEEAHKFMGQRFVVDKAHNDFLQIAITEGIPALLFYICFLVVLLKRTYGSIPRSRLLVPLFCCLIGYIIQEQFSYSVVSVAPVYWALLGIAAKYSEQH